MNESHTQSEQTWEKATENLEMLQVLVDTVPAYISFVDAEERYRLVNLRYEEWFGRPRAEIVGRTIRDVQGEETYQRMRPNVALALAGERVHYEHFLVDHLGVGHYLDNNYVPHRAPDGAVLGFFVLVFDLSARKRAEAERDRLLVAERQARAEAEAAVRAREEFLAIAAHELTNPITSLLLSTEMLETAGYSRRRGNKRERILVEEIRRVCRRLGLIASDLLDVARLQSGRFPLNRQPIDLAVLARAVVEQVRSRSPNQEISVLGGPGLVASVDAERIEQVVANVLENAVKYSASGGKIRVELCRHDSGILMHVTDQGIGLPPDATELIFQPFGRAPNAARRRLPGMGLGLYIARQIVESHGGRIWAQSDGEDRGMTLSIWLPANAPDAEARL